MNYNEIQTVIGGYVAVYINDPKISLDEFSTFIYDVVTENNIANVDLINVLNTMTVRAQSDDRVIGIINSLGLKLPSVKKDLFQVYFHYYLKKGNYDALKSSIAIYKAQYGEDEHTIVAEMRLLFENNDGDIPIEQLKTLVDKAKSYL